MYCPKCGAPIPDTARFCGKCGAQMPAAEGANAYHEQQPPEPAVKKRTAFSMGAGTTGMFVRILIIVLAVAAAVIFVGKPVISRISRFDGSARFVSQGDFLNSEISFTGEGKYMSISTGEETYKCKIRAAHMESGDLIYELDAPDEMNTGQDVSVEGIAVRIPRGANKGEAEGTWGYAMLIDDTGGGNYVTLGTIFAFEKGGEFSDITLMGSGNITGRDARINEAVDLLSDEAIKTMETDESNLAVRMQGHWMEEADGYRMEYDDVKTITYLTIEP